MHTSIWNPADVQCPTQNLSLYYIPCCWSCSWRGQTGTMLRKNFTCHFFMVILCGFWLKQGQTIYNSNSLPLNVLKLFFTTFQQFSSFMFRHGWWSSLVFQSKKAMEVDWLQVQAVTTHTCGFAVLHNMRKYSTIIVKCCATTCKISMSSVIQNKGLISYNNLYLFCTQSLDKTKTVSAVEILLNLCTEQYLLEFSLSTDNMCFVQDT
jgi:hypothetical protein